MLIKDKRGNWTTVSSFEEARNILGEYYQPQSLTAPPEKFVPDIEIGEGVADPSVELARGWLNYGRKVHDWILFRAKPRLEEMRQAAEEIGPRYLELPFGIRESEDGQKGKTNSQVMEELDEEIKEHCESAEPLEAEQAELALLIYRLSVPMDHESFCRLLEELVKEDVLVEDENGDIKPFSSQTAFSLPPDLLYYVHNDAVKEIKKVIEAQANRLKRAHLTEIQNKEEKLKKESEISVLQAWNNKKGLCAMEVDEGIIQVQFQKETHIVDASGRPLNGVNEMKRLENQYKVPIVVLWSDIKTEAGCLVERNYRLPRSSLEIPSHVRDANDKKSWFNSTALAWNLTRRAFEIAGVDTGQTEKVDDPVYQNLQKQATLTAYEAHMLHKPGRYLTALHPQFSHFDHTVENVAVLLSIKEDSEGKKIRLACTLPHCEEFFAACMDEYPLNEKFAGLPNPLGNFLRRDFAVNVVANGTNRNQGRRHFHNGPRN